MSQTQTQTQAGRPPGRLNRDRYKLGQVMEGRGVKNSTERRMDAVQKLLEQATEPLTQAALEDRLGLERGSLFGCIQNLLAAHRISRVGDAFGPYQPAPRPNPGQAEIKVYRIKDLPQPRPVLSPIRPISARPEVLEPAPQPEPEPEPPEDQGAGSSQEPAPSPASAEEIAQAIQQFADSGERLVLTEFYEKYRLCTADFQPYPELKRRLRDLPNLVSKRNRKEKSSKRGTVRRQRISQAIDQIEAEGASLPNPNSSSASALNGGTWTTTSTSSNA